MLCVELSRTTSGRISYLPKDPRELKEYNRELNNSNLKDPFGMIHMLLQWIYKVWAMTAARKCHSAAFPIFQSAGCGKTKLIRSLALIEKPFWVTHLMCRHFQAMVQSPIVAHLHHTLGNAAKKIDGLNLEELLLKAQREELSDEEKQRLLSLIEAVSQEMIRIFVCIVKLVGSMSEKAKMSQEAGERECLEKQYAKLFHFMEEGEDRDTACQVGREILGVELDGRDLKTQLIEAIAKLDNKQFIICFDEARGLFGKDAKVDDLHSLVYRGIRRASRFICRHLENVKGALAVFIFMDTNARLGNLTASLAMQPYRGSSDTIRGIEEEPDDLPLFPPFPFILTHNVHALEYLEGQLDNPRPVLRNRVKGSFAGDAQSLLASLGRPLWKSLCDVGPISFQELVERMAINMKSFVKSRGVNERRPSYLSEELIEGVHPGLYSLLVFRMPLRLKARRGLAAYMLECAFGTLVHADGANELASVVFLAEPVLAAASSYLMRTNIDPLLKMIEGKLSLFSLDAGIGAELMVMLMALAATDHLTGYRPYHAVSLDEWFCAWLGLPARTLPEWCRGALVQCSQFTTYNLTGADWSWIEIARVEGVGIVSTSSQQPGYDLLIPFELHNGNAGALVVRVNNDSSLENKKLEDAKTSLLNACHKLVGIKEIQVGQVLTLEESQRKADEDAKKLDKYKLVPIIVNLQHGRLIDAASAQRENPNGACLYICTNVLAQNFTKYIPIALTGSNTWGKAQTMTKLMGMMEDDSAFHLKEWKNILSDWELNNVDADDAVNALVASIPRYKEYFSDRKSAAHAPGNNDEGGACETGHVASDGEQPPAKKARVGEN